MDDANTPTAYDDAVAEINKILKSCEGLPIADALAKTRVEAQRAIERVCEARGVLHRLQSHPPGAILTVTQNAVDPSVIQVQLSDRLKKW